MSISENERYWQHRAQRAEAECERLRGRINEIANDFVPFPGQEGLALDEMREALTALATPPPEGEQDTCGPCGCSLVGAKFYPVTLLGLQVAVCPDCAEREGESTDERHTPEQTSPKWEPPSVLAEIWPDTEDEGPHQAHGDALAALDTLVDAAMDETGWLWPDVAEHEASKIRPHLTASGVPYIPEEVRRLPKAWRSNAAFKEDSAKERHGQVGTLIIGEVDQQRRDADTLERALASAPADWVAVLEREDWGLVPVSVPTGGDDYDVEWTVIEYHMAEPKERVIGRGRTPKHALSDAAAPPRGGD